VQDDDAFIAAIVDAPDDIAVRLVYADWLEERGHPGAEYLRTEAALVRADDREVKDLRHDLLRIIPGLPRTWRDRFEQPDVILAPPMPFAMGWYAMNAEAPKPYRTLPNLDPRQLSPDLPWLSVVHPEERVDQVVHEREELLALQGVKQRSSRLDLALPPGFESFAQDFPRRNEVSHANSYFEFFLHDAATFDFPQVGDGYLVTFFADMDYGNPHQVVWSLYLIPRIAWHCVVAYEIPNDMDYRTPPDSARLVYCAPSFQAFLYRWWLGT
jgi:uncharacterized protein (TIGR02996 family)